MIKSDKNLLSEFDLGLDQLIDFSNSQIEENARLKREIAEKEGIIKKLMLKNDQLKKLYNNLKFAKSMDSNEDSESRLEAKSRLAKLVQDVDKCITLLKS